MLQQPKDDTSTTSKFLLFQQNSVKKIDSHAKIIDTETLHETLVRLNKKPRLRVRLFGLLVYIVCLFSPGIMLILLHTFFYNTTATEVYSNHTKQVGYKGENKTLLCKIKH